MTRFTTALGAAMAAAWALASVPTAGALANTSQPLPAAHRTDRIAQSRPTGSGPRTWHVLVGGQSKDRAVQAEGYYPHVITIDAGDTVVWTLNTTEIHAVAFAGTCEDFSCIPPDCLTVNIDASPCGPPDYDGVTGWDSSGRMVPAGYKWDSSVPHGGTTYSLRFTRPGVNIYFDLSYAGMRGVVIVNPAGTPYPLTPGQYSARGRQQLKADLAAGARARAAAARQATTSANPDGSRTHHVAVGASAPARAKAVLRPAPGHAAHGTALLDGSGIGASTDPVINVKIRLSGLVPGSIHAVQILPGVCGAPAQTTGIIFSQLFVPPTFTLNSVTAGPDGTAAGTTAVTAPPNYNGPGQLRIPSAGWFVNVAAGPVPDNGVSSAACGNVAFHAATVMRYFPQDVRVRAGDTVVWTNDTSEVHGVTFLAGQPLPQIPEWYSSSPTGNGVDYDGSSFFNSGPLYAADAGRNHSLTLTFTKTGTFHYVDVGDFLLGMQGKVRVVHPRSRPHITHLHGGRPEGTRAVR